MMEKELHSNATPSLTTAAPLSTKALQKTDEEHKIDTVQ